MIKITTKNYKIYLVVLVIIFAIVSLLRYKNTSQKNNSNNFVTQPTSLNFSSGGDTAVEVLKTQAEEMGQALVEGDYDTYITYIDPKVVEYAGGKNNLIKILKLDNPEAYKLLSFSFGGVSKIIKSKGELQATIPQTVVVLVNDAGMTGRLLTKSTLIAISGDEGKHWLFVDTAQKSIDTIQTMVPNLSPLLDIPENPSPVFYSSTKK
jgi:hypothetical protein